MYISSIENPACPEWASVNLAGEGLGIVHQSSRYGLAPILLATIMDPTFSVI